MERKSRRPLPHWISGLSFTLGMLLIEPFLEGVRSLPVAVVASAGFLFLVHGS